MENQNKKPAKAGIYKTDKGLLYFNGSYWECLSSSKKVEIKWYHDSPLIEQLELF